MPRARPGSLHVGNALSAVANRDFGDWLLLRIDDTDPARNVPGGEEEILRDLEWLGVAWDEGPIRQSERQDSVTAEAAAAAAAASGSAGITLLRADGTATYQLASVVDDIEFGITHVIRGNDHRPNEQLHRELTEALGATPPEYVHHGLILGEDGRKLSKREFGSTVASLRDAGIPAEAVRALPGRARHPEARRALRPSAHPPARDRGDRRDVRRGAGGRGRSCRRGRPGAARRTRPGRGA